MRRGATGSGAARRRARHVANAGADRRAAPAPQSGPRRPVPGEAAAAGGARRGHNRRRATADPRPRPSGSHTALSLLDAGHAVTIFDNLDNSFEKCYVRMQELAGDKAGGMKFVKVKKKGMGFVVAT